MTSTDPGASEGAPAVGAAAVGAAAPGSTGVVGNDVGAAAVEGAAVRAAVVGGGAAGGTDYAALVSALRRTFAAGTTRPQTWRMAQLNGLRSLLSEREDELLAALAADLGKPPLEARLTEIGNVSREIGHLSRNLERWASPQRVGVRPMLRPGRASVVSEPLGAVLVISPWNYPLHLLVLPVAYALAAGNVVVAKPSELAPATSAALARLMPLYVDPDAVCVVEGGHHVAGALLEQRWDHIFFTGSGRVARIVARAAAEHLTPVTLELGGKNPTIVHRDADLKVAARRIAWAKFLNAGQSCVAPDYVLVERQVEAELVGELAKTVERFYGVDASRSGDLARIVSRTHFDRLVGLIENRRTARIVVGGQYDAERLFVAPTVATEVSWEEPMMEDEIFGPILPILTVEDLDEAIATVGAGGKPLAAYVFSESKAAVERVVKETSSGAVVANAAVVHMAVPDLPFGGVGESGMGAYHGRAGFDTFSHRKAVLERASRPDVPLVYPPYTKMKTWLMRHVL